MSGNKSRVLHLLRYLRTNSDSEHVITTKEIIDLFANTDEKCNRVTLANDIATLREEGYDVRTVISSANYYYLGDREFEPEEIKLLIDAVSASHFISNARSVELIDKLKGFESKYKAEELTRHLYFAGSTKTSNVRAFDLVDEINGAINDHRKISFQYYQYTPGKTRTLRDHGKTYVNSPYYMVYTNDHYYLVGWSDEHEKVVQFRIDRMKNLKITKEKAKTRRGFHIDRYVQENFSMYAGDDIHVTLECDNDMMDAIIDRFGGGVATSQSPDGTYFTAEVTVGDSPTFYAWVFMFGGKIKITGGERAVKNYEKMMRTARKKRKKMSCVSSEN